MDNEPLLLTTFVGLRVLQAVLESGLAAINRRFYLDRVRQDAACSTLGIEPNDFAKTLAYTDAKYKFGFVSYWFGLAATIGFLAAGGLGWLEQFCRGWGGTGEIYVGLLFFCSVGILATIAGLPFDWYQTFVLEEKHGFNRQTRAGFVKDKIKGLVIVMALGGILLSGILFVMGKMGSSWWIWAWAVTTLFSLFTAWIYPTFVAPIFNKFTPVADDALRQEILALANRVGFKAGGIFVMDASTRSTHGNAYFTGIFGEKRIVLFDTLLKSLTNREIVAVLAHELGHFRLNHVRWGLLRGVLSTGVVFFLFSLVLPMEEFYRSFGLSGVSNYGALIVFSLWFGIVDFYLQPIGSFLSRRNEFAADRFARHHLDGGSDLIAALLKLRESNQGMPITHPWYSMVYLSHPPLMERVSALKA